MSPADAHALALKIHKARESQGLSMRALADTSGVNRATVVHLEHGEISMPHADTLMLLARRLDIPVSDLYTAAGWLPGDQLPDLKPYLRSKFPELDRTQISEVEHYVAHVRSTCVCPNKTTAS